MKTKHVILLTFSILSIHLSGQTVGDVLNCDSLNYFEKILMINDNNREIYDSSSLAEQKRFHRWQTFWTNRVDTAGSQLTYPLIVMDYIKNQPREQPIQFILFFSRMDLMTTRFSQVVIQQLQNLITLVV